MIKIAHEKELDQYKNCEINSSDCKFIHEEIIESTRGILRILDEEYGEDRDIDKDLGGYVLILENKEDQLLLANIHIDIYDVIPEYVHRITVNNGENWICAMMLLNSDYSVSIVLKENEAPGFLIQLIEENKCEVEAEDAHITELTMDTTTQYGRGKE